MIWLELETITGSDNVDDWKITPDIVIEYFNRMISEALPDYTSAAIIPGKLDQISFNNDKATDTNKIAKSTETLFNSSGGAQILNSASISGTTAFSAAVKADTEMAISMLLPETQGWVNRFLTYWVSTPAKVKFFEVSAYTKDEFKQAYKKIADINRWINEIYNDKRCDIKLNFECIKNWLNILRKRCFLKYDNIYNPANGHKIYIDNGIFSRIVDRINNISIVTCIEYPESKWTYNEDEWEKYYKTEKELIANNCKWR